MELAFLTKNFVVFFSCVSPPDPFAQVCFMTHSQVTEKVPKTLCPTWDQSLIFNDVEVFGHPKQNEQEPPHVYIELFDYDYFVSLNSIIAAIFIQKRDVRL